MMRLLSILAVLVVSAPAAFGHPPVGIAFYDVVPGIKRNV